MNNISSSVVLYTTKESIYNNINIIYILHQPKRKMRQDYLFLYKDLVYIKYINLL